MIKLITIQYKPKIFLNILCSNVPKIGAKAFFSTRIIMNKYDVWQHFSRYRLGKEARAICLLCNTDIRGQSRVVHRHLETTCPKGAEIVALIKNTDKLNREKLFNDTKNYNNTIDSINTNVTTGTTVNNSEQINDVNVNNSINNITSLSTTSEVQNSSTESSTMAQYFQIVQNVDDLKRLYPNISLDNVQVVSVTGDDGINQQVLITQDDSLVLNENQIQQVVYQQNPQHQQQHHHQQQQQHIQNQQPSTHYILQQDDDHQLSQSQIYYSTSEVTMDTDQIIQQHQMNQVQHQQQQQQQQQQPQQQVVLQHIQSPSIRQQQSNQQQILIQKTSDTNSRQMLSTQVLMQQTPTAQSNPHQHILLQQTPHVVLQQQTIQQTNQAHQPTQQHIVMRQNLPQQRIVYTQQPRTVVFQNTQQMQQHHQQQVQQQQQIQQQQQQQVQQQQVQQQQHQIQQHQIQQQIQNQQTQQIVHQDIQTLTTQRQTNSPHTRMIQQRQQAIVTPLQQQQNQIQQQNVIYQHINQQSTQTSTQTIQQQQQQQQRVQQQQIQIDQNITNQQSQNQIQTNQPAQVQQVITPRVTQTIKATPNMNRINITQIPNPQIVRPTIRFTSPTSTTTNNQHPFLTLQSTKGRRVNNSTSVSRGRGVRTNIRQSVPAKTIIQQATAQQSNQTVTVTRQDVAQAVQSPIVNQHHVMQQQKQQQSVQSISAATVQKSFTSQSQATSTNTSTVVTPTPLGLKQHRLISNQIQQKLFGSNLQRQQEQSSNTVVNIKTAGNAQIKYRNLPVATGKAYQGNNSLDIEESIQAVVVPKHTEAPNAITTSTSMSTTTAGESKSFDTTLTTYYTENSDEDKKLNKLTNGRVMNLLDYKKMQKQDQQTSKIQSNTRGINTTVPVNRVAPTQIVAPTKSAVGQTQTISTGNEENSNILRNVSQTSNQQQSGTQHQQQQQSKNQQFQLQETDGQKSARMLVILKTGEQRLITFTLPRESCTVQELLEQVGVPFTPKTNIQVVSNPGANIDYVVTVGISVQESTSELISAAEHSLQLTKQQESTATTSTSTSTQHQHTETKSERSTSSQGTSTTDTLKDTPTKIIQGYLALCPNCGYTGYNHAKCERCLKVFTEEPKKVSCSKQTSKNEEERKKLLQQQSHSTQMMQTEYLNRPEGRASLVIASHRGRGGLTSARGRGRGASRNKTTEAEPVVLTLSSDDEDTDEKSNKSVTKATTIEPTSIQKPPLPCEPIINESDGSFQEMERESVCDFTNSSGSGNLSVDFFCKLIRIGTHRFEPTEKIYFTTKGIRIVAPSCSDPVDNTVLNIQTREIAKVIAHFGKTLPVLFIYTLPKCGQYIRESLGMKPKNLSLETPYYNPTDRSEPYKRIVIQPENITETVKTVIKSIFSKSVLEEISLSDANELLLRSCSKDKLIKTENAAIKLETENIRQILIYPPGKGGISINTEDYMCLAIDQYLNDIIIDFYLNYLHLNVLTEEQREQTHIFSTFFYKRLTTMTARQRQTEKDAKLTPSQKRHARVKNWTKNVNLFEKDFIIIPINEQSHWFLAIICYPSLKGPVTYDTNIPVAPQSPIKKKKMITERKISLQIGSTTITPLSKRETDPYSINDDSMSERDEAEGDESDLLSEESDSESAQESPTKNESQPIKQPLILIFDSLSGASRSRVVATLRDYLTCEYKAKIKEDTNHTFNKSNMPGHCVKVPQQNNFTDCGLYLLQYVEQFFKDPIRDYRIPIKQLVNWFETIVVTRKREEISNLIKDLVSKYTPDRLPLPDIAFPTIKGKLIEQDESFNEAEFEEEELDEEYEEEDDEEMGLETENEISEKIHNGDEKREVKKRSLEEIGGKVYEATMRKNAKIDHTI